ncbi:MAG TPA: hypothetical protein VMG08_19070 [Allosphingosinicella sp.]|nr:hypothetical protein [Allosphingosinicella sp.]
MALAKAVIAGGIAALGLPWAFRGGGGALADWVQASSVHFNLAGVHLIWSWTIFCVITLFAWALIAWAGRT